MNKFLSALLLCFILLSAKAQEKRNVRFKIIDRDSVNMPLTDGYFLIEDSCAQIIRYSRYNMATRRFYNKFTDVSKNNHNLIVGEGFYNADGLKNGLFTLHYLNGNLQAKGYFKNGKYDGKWDVFYADGKPEISFEITDGDYHIINFWKTDGTKIVDNGTGVYTADLIQMYWKGKLINGKPDGIWKLFRTDDATNTELATEHFKKNKFVSGNNGNFDYTNASHIDLVNTFKLPFENAETLYVSPNACDGTKKKHLVGAQYKDGLNIFSSYISEAIVPYLGRVDLKGIDNTVDIVGEVSEKGNLINLKNNGSLREDISRGLILRLQNLPVLVPANADGIPVKQKFTITLIISHNLYKYSYRFGEILSN
jgi:antitoxin component YwqK of YwqJK toxin-antitoxin module